MRLTAPEELDRLGALTKPTFGFPQNMQPLFPAIHNGGTTVNGVYAPTTATTGMLTCQVGVPIANSVMMAAMTSNVSPAYAHSRSARGTGARMATTPTS